MNTSVFQARTAHAWLAHFDDETASTTGSAPHHVSQHDLASALVHIVGAWALGLVAIFVAGAMLSALTLRTARRAPAEETGRARGGVAILRSAYRVVLWLCCAYFYLSLPLVALTVVAVAGALIVAVLQLGLVSIKLAFVVASIALATIGAILRGVMAAFERHAHSDPGERLDLRRHPRLASLLREVALRIGTRPVDVVFVTFGAEVAVTERSGVGSLFGSRSERCLVLGAGVLDGLRVRELKAILAHEFGHFRNDDTAGGTFARAVMRSMLRLNEALERGGAANLLNPAWWFVAGFAAVFLRISFGAMRLQEILADRWAIFAYGADAFESGFRHVIVRGVQLRAHVEAKLPRVIAARQASVNLYDFTTDDLIDRVQIAQRIDAELDRDAGPYEAHPAPKDRIAWAQRFAAKGVQAAPGDADPAWSLVDDREGLELQMTALLRDAIARRGVRPRAA